ncbi:MAG TPA: hypothetical protein VL977_05175, partial [Solirubrobacteraceae bacterium]|nr:hypothetical protein [Solirubrobacteraceae bacterium]
MSGGFAQALAALAGYCALSALLYGRQALGSLHHVVVGFGQEPPFYGHDQSAYVWSLAWVAHSLTHLQSPFLAHAIFAPVGYNLAWAASILGPGLLSAPLTLTLGAVPTYNLLALAAPAGAAWAAFLLCRHVSGRAAPALAGGLLFGFGMYGTGEAINHLNLALVALVPLAALLVLRRYEQRTSRRRFVLALGALLGLQLWTSTEVFASMAIFAALAFVLAALLAPRARRARIGLCAGEALGALLLALLLAAPLLYYALSHPNPVSAIPTTDAGADLANFVIPTSAIWLHGWKAVARSAAELHGNLTEQLAYLGIPLILLLGAYALECRRTRLARCLTIFIALSAIASLGAHLFIDGEATGIWLPWSLFDQLPLLRFATPGRFVLYTWLAAALAVSLWLSRPSRAPLRWLAFLLVLATLTPNLSGVSWGTRVDAPPLMRAPLLARYVPRGAAVLALPFGIWGDSMFWQVQADFRFRLAGGYVSTSPPAAYRQYIYLLRALGGGPIEGHPNQRLCGFLRMTGTRVVALREGAPGQWARLLRPLRVLPQRVGGFWVYELGAPGGAP